MVDHRASRTRDTLNAGASTTLAAHVAPVRRESGTNWEKACENNRLAEQRQIIVPASGRTSRASGSATPDMYRCLGMDEYLRRVGVREDVVHVDVAATLRKAEERVP